MEHALLPLRIRQGLRQHHRRVAGEVRLHGETDHRRDDEARALLELYNFRRKHNSVWLLAQLHIACERVLGVSFIT